jgi:hypothetical protein
MDKFVFWSAALMFLLTLALPTTAHAAAGDQAAFHGVLLDAKGQPAVGNPMAIKTPDGRTVVFKGTGDDGSFGLSGLDPGTYEVLALQPKDGKTPLASKTVTLAAGQKARLEMRLSTNAAAAVAPAIPEPPATAAGSKDSEGAGAGSGVWKLSMLAGFGTLAICLASVIYLGRRSRQQVVEEHFGD